MKKGIKFRKLKRKAKNIVLWAITYFMVAMIFASSFIHAFGNPSWVHGLMCVIGFAWCLAFSYVNTKGE